MASAISILLKWGKGKLNQKKAPMMLLFVFRLMRFAGQIHIAGEGEIYRFPAQRSFYAQKNEILFILAPRREI
jgi:hypothetical protein